MRQIPFPVLMGISSRGLIILVMLGLAPLLPAPSGGIQAEWGWDVFSALDSDHYQAIATQGYGGAPNGAISPLYAFFPLFPLLMRGLMVLGLPFSCAGVLVSTVGFCLALAVVERWVTEEWDATVARWAVAVLAWFPLSMFCTVTYTEGLFLGLSSLTLYQFHRQRYGQAALWGALTTATRVTGLALLPALLLVAWKERRSTIAAFGAAVAPLVGIGAYSGYCYWSVGRPLAFLEAQKYWQVLEVAKYGEDSGQLVWGTPWLRMFSEVVFGPANTDARAFVDPIYPAIVLLIGGLSWGLSRVWSRWSEARRCGCAAVLIIGFWLLGGNPVLNTSIVLGTLLLLWHTRTQLQSLPWLYSLTSLAIIFSSGRTTSAERYIYGIVTISMALGLVLSRYPLRGRLLLGFFGLLLVLMSLRFAQHLWVA